MANVRYQLTQDVYMPLDGQWGVVGAGTVFDDAPNVTYAKGHATVLAETASALGSHARATSVRNVSRR